VPRARHHRQADQALLANHTGKVERWHQTLRCELLDPSGLFADLPSAQSAITAWVHAYLSDRLWGRTPRPASLPHCTCLTG
jgi:Integrase core domain